MCCQRWTPSLCTCQMHAPPLNYKFPKLLRMLNRWSYPRPRKPDVSCCYVLLLIKTRGKVTHAQCQWNFLFQILLIHSWLNPCCGAYRGGGWFYSQVALPYISHTILSYFVQKGSCGSRPKVIIADLHLQVLIPCLILSSWLKAGSVTCVPANRIWQKLSRAILSQHTGVSQ